MGSIERVTVTDDRYCFHCRELLPTGNPHAFSCHIGEALQYFCCPACRTVAQTISRLGLEQHYQQRDSKPQQPPTSAGHFADADLDDNRQRIMHNIDGLIEAQLFVPDIHCASCCWLIEQHLSTIDGVDTVQAQLDNHKLRVRCHDPAVKPSTLLAALAQIGYRATPWQPTTQQQHSEQQQRQLLRRLGVAGILAMQIHMIAMGDYFGASDAIQHWLNIVALLLSLPVWFYCATPFLSGAQRNLKTLWTAFTTNQHSHTTAGMDLPVAIAIVAAAIASVIAVIWKTDDLYFDSIAMFVFLLLGARYLEARARARMASQSQEPELPDSCTRLCNHLIERIPLSRLRAGDTVLVESGVIPVDGTVINGEASIDQSAITGEFLPVDRTVGDQVIAGTLLLSGTLQLRARHWGESSHVAQLHRQMEQSLTRKQGRTLQENTARWFTPLVLLTALASALFWLWQEPARALPAFLAVLVASCPCALSLAIPAALTAATLQLRRQGILVTGNQVLQYLPEISQFAFDKTGTLTQGRMQRLQTRLLSSEDEQTCLSIAAALEQHNSHPVAHAFQDIEPPSWQTSNTEQVMHCGVRGNIEGHHYRIGKAAWAAPGLIHDETLQEGTTIALSKENPVEKNTGEIDPGEKSPGEEHRNTLQVLALFTLNDSLRGDASSCLNTLRQQNSHIAIVSGDDSVAVSRIAKQLGITDIHQNCSPEEKVIVLEQMKTGNRLVAMVGDGINDGPVLAHADVSIALADASQTAQLAADVVLLNNRLSDLLLLQKSALSMRRIARQNLIWAVTYNLCILPIAAAGYLPPVIAAGGMAISSLLVTFNALRLFSAPDKTGQQDA